MNAESDTTEVSIGLEPICDSNIDTLVLGSLPSRMSIASGQYYGNPRNAFWPLMASLLDFDPEVPYVEKTQALLAAGIGLWDVLHSSSRPGSLDANIDLRTARPNDFAAFVVLHPRLSRICFNGRKAAEMFRRFDCLPESGYGSGVDRISLPSTSPAHAAMGLAEKRAAWAVVTRPRNALR